jgi:NADPH-dependent ferric siderophore reductase
VRIVAGGPGFDAFQPNDFTNMYAKIVFVDPELGLAPPYDDRLSLSGYWAYGRTEDIFQPEKREPIGQLNG